ncbi:alpha/beta hydrolase (plasmid) [Marivivens sp. LCG002]|uniref:alpha/beta fold hydrolase n=1 Tax=Marivivens sp. LCG002 TaxID=3051171 RepID=UPI0025573D81|nr:alpha/beta hydrolase [Marivivens sp. LCG002]WIV52399.1 alpha/beta hydrolase [Marivivens sp. LCG002]
MFRRIAAVLAFATLAACGDTTTYLRESLSTSVTSLPFSEGGERFDLYQIRKTENPSEIAFFVGGSGCTSLSVYLAPYFAALNPEISIYAVDKKGVSKGALGLHCSDTFWENYAYDTLVERNAIALNAVHKLHPDRTISIIGTSEGGPIATALAATHAGVSKLVLIGAGGQTQRQELEQILPRPTFEHLQKTVATSPQSVTDFTLGYPHRYWTSILDHDPRALMQGLDLPTLILIGEKDESVPVASAAVAQSLIKGAELVIWPDADHTFDTPQGPARDQMIARVGDFILR